MYIAKLSEISNVIIQINLNIELYHQLNWRDIFIYISQGCFPDTGAILEEMGKIPRHEPRAGHDESRFIEPVNAFSRANNPGLFNKIPPGGADMNIQNVMLFYYAVTSNVCLRHG